MNTDQIRCFCTVVEQRGFTRAARHLFLSQPAVSQQVQALEQSLGVMLLDRSRRPLVPTEAGEAIYQYGVELLERVAAIRDVADRVKGLHGGRVTVAAGIGPGQYVLPPLIARFRRQYPEIRVELTALSTPRAFEQVVRGTADLGIGINDRVPARLVARVLYRDEIVLVAGPGHPWARRPGRAVPLRWLASQPLVAPAAHSLRIRHLCKERLQAAGVEPNVEMEFETPEAVKRVVAGGEGAAFLARSNVTAEVAAGLLKVVAVEGLALHAEYVVVWRPRQHHSPAVQAFLAFLDAAFAGAERLPVAAGAP